MSRPTVEEPIIRKCPSCNGKGYRELEAPKINLELNVNPKPMRIPCLDCGGNCYYTEFQIRDMDNDEWLENLEERISKIEDRLNEV